jgi:general secretion pathway protein J
VIAMTAQRSRGFTLIEVLVAVLLLAVLSALAYETLSYVHKARDGSVAAFDRLREVELGLHTLVADFEQLEPRPVRQPVGDGYLGAFVGDTRTKDLAVLTRGGWPNSAGLPRGTLQRVTYTFDPDKAVLYRSYTTALDAPLSVQPVKRELLKNVASVTFRYRDTNAVWQPQWPPPGAQTPVAATSIVAPLRLRPVAVEITVELKDWGKLVRIVEVPG